MPMAVYIPQMNVQKREINIFNSYQWEVVMQFACKYKQYNVKVMNQGEIRIFTLQLGCLLEFDYRKNGRYPGQPTQTKVVKSKSTGNLHMGIKLKCSTGMI